MIQGFRYVLEYKIVIVYIYIYISFYTNDTQILNGKKKKKCYRETESTQPVKSSKTIFVRFVPESLAVYPQRIDRITAPIERRFHVTFVTRYRRFFSPGITTGYVRRRARMKSPVQRTVRFKKKKKMSRILDNRPIFLDDEHKMGKIKKKREKEKRNK